MSRSLGVADEDLYDPRRHGSQNGQAIAPNVVIRYRARWVLPISSPPIADGVVVVKRDKIEYVGTSDGCGPAGDEINLGDALLMPGLRSTRIATSSSTAMRGYLEDLEFRRWILRLTASRRAVLDRDALLDSARYGLEEGIRAGITSYADTCESGVVMQAMREAGVRGIMYQEVRSRSDAVRRVDGRPARARRRFAISGDAARSRRHLAARAVHRFRRSLSRRRRDGARPVLKWRFISPRVSWNVS